MAAAVAIGSERHLNRALNDFQDNFRHNFRHNYQHISLKMVQKSSGAPLGLLATAGCVGAGCFDTEYFCTECFVADCFDTEYFCTECFVADCFDTEYFGAEYFYAERSDDHLWDESIAIVRELD